MKKQYFFLLLPFGRLQTIESLIICRRMALRICCLLTAVLHALFAENKLSMSELAKLIGRKKYRNQPYRDARRKRLLLP